ncbi:MAG: alpha/beta hydrolase [Anaerolineales bacterium]
MKSELNYFAHQVENIKYPPVILLHGAGGFHLSWPPTIRRMQEHAIYALDLCGHGKSKGDGWKNIDEHVNDVVQFMNSLGLKQVALTGHSMGGAIALSLAVQHPELVSSLILISTGSKLGVSPALLEAASRVETFPAAIEMLVENSFSRYADARTRELTKQRLLLTNPLTFHADLLACHAFNMQDSLPFISVPTLVVCGSLDQMTPPKYSQTLHDHIPNSKLEFIPNAGHMLMLERPDSVLQIMIDFLESQE